MGEVSIQRTN